MRTSSYTNEQLTVSAQRMRAFGGAYAKQADVYEELIDRREADASELRQLGASIAYRAAASAIENGVAEVGPAGSEWFDLNDPFEFWLEDATEAARYLELRGLLERDPTTPNHVAIRNESEATA